MSTIAEEIAKLTKASADQTSASQVLAQEVAGKMAAIDARTAEQKTKVDSYILAARSEMPVFRLTKNQLGRLTDSMLDDYHRNTLFPLTFSLHREVVSGKAWADRDAEEKEIMTAMGLSGIQHFQPNIRIIKMQWSGWNSSMKGNTFHQTLLGGTAVTSGCYAKIVSGAIDQGFFTGANSQWGVCGKSTTGKPGQYSTSHPYVSSETGEILFCWPAVVAGVVPLDRSNPRWGFYPFINGDTAAPSVSI